MSRTSGRTTLAESLADSLIEPAIRRYDMHWLQNAAASINRRSERSQRQRLLNVTVLGVDHLFDTSDVPSRSSGSGYSHGPGLRRSRSAPTSDPGVGR